MSLALIVSCSLSGCDSGMVITPNDDGGGPGKEASAEDGVLIFPDGKPVDTGPKCAAGTTVCGNSCCTADQICLSGLCKNLGPACDELWPCPAGFFCDKTKKRCTPGAKKCEYKPPVGVFTPKMKWEWTKSTTAPAWNQVMMAPMVANMTDDNKDGKIDRNDIPDIVFHTFTGKAYTVNGILRVISGDGKKEHYSITATAHRTHPGTQVALGDIDNDSKPEIVACASGGGVIAFEDNGAFKWKAAGIPCKAPSLADLDGDGNPEVVACYAALHGATGKVKWNSGIACGSYSTVADIDEDGKPEVVGGNVVLANDGKVIRQDSSRPDGYVAIADLNGNGKPEIVTASASDHSLRAYHHDGKKYWGPVDINQGQANLGDKCKGCGGGPPTIADFDGDGKPEIAAAAGYGYVVFEHDGKAKWFKATQDKSSRQTGSSVFDFEGDGKAEVVYADELVMRIYEGTSGKVLYSICNTSGTLVEYPVIVDVDNDDHAEIVVMNNNYAFKTCAGGAASHTGIKVLTDAKNNWVRTRRIWNQHTYHVTNIDEDGRIPKVEQRNWDNPALNNFRQNVQPGGLFDAPDVTPAKDKTSCESSIKATVNVKNEGAAKVVPGLNVTLYVKDPTKGNVALKTVQTKTTIYPGGTEKVTFDVPTPKEYHNKTIDIFAVVDDDGTGKGSINECNEKNNTVQLGLVLCKVIG